MNAKNDVLCGGRGYQKRRVFVRLWTACWTLVALIAWSASARAANLGTPAPIEVSGETPAQGQAKGDGPTSGTAAGLAIPRGYTKAVTEALGKAGDNATELAKAIRTATASQREAVCFLVANMPDRDLRGLSAAYVLEHVEYAYKARESTPWGSGIPDEIFLNNVLPYASVNERRDNWRKDFYERFLPIVKDCKSAGGAAMKLNREMFKMVNVQYHATKRPRPDQSPYESIQAGYASCTGLSILLIDACRAVGVPARFAGTPQWTTKRGNHSWVEVWDGQWRFTGAIEPDEKGLNHAWFEGDAAKAGLNNRENWIYATSFKKTPLFFPLVWNDSIRYVKAKNVTKYYTDRHPVEIQVLSKPNGKPVEAEVRLRLEGELYAMGKTAASGGKTLVFELPGGETYEAEVSVGALKPPRQTLTTTSEPNQKAEFYAEKP